MINYIKSNIEIILECGKEEEDWKENIKNENIWHLINSEEIKKNGKKYLRKVFLEDWGWFYGKEKQMIL